MMPDPFFEEYYDVLLNIETTIEGFYQLEPQLTDHNAIKVLDILIRYYQAQEHDNTLTRPTLSPVEKRLYERLEDVCKLHMGGLKDRLPEDTAGEAQIRRPDEMVACLKRIRDSARKMNAKGGKRSYLDFLRVFFSQG